MLAKLKAWAALAGALLLAGVLLFFKGKTAARREITAQRAKDTAKAIEERAKLDDEISNDSDLLNRARNSGVVRNER